MYDFDSFRDNHIIYFQRAYLGKVGNNGVSQIYYQAYHLPKRSDYSDFLKDGCQKNEAIGRRQLLLNGLLFRGGNLAKAVVVPSNREYPVKPNGNYRDAESIAA